MSQFIYPLADMERAIFELDPFSFASSEIFDGVLVD
jgi:hypothetical protein